MIRLKLQFKSLVKLSISGAGPQASECTQLNNSVATEAIQKLLFNSSRKKTNLRKGKNPNEFIIDTSSLLFSQENSNSFLSPLRLEPYSFLSLSSREKNAALLSLISFHWDKGWILSQFGEIPPEVDYSRHILYVLSDIHKLYRNRQSETKKSLMAAKAGFEQLSAQIPPDYCFEKWADFNMEEKLSELRRRKAINTSIARAKLYIQSLGGRLEAVEAERYADRTTAERSIHTELELYLSREPNPSEAQAFINGLEKKLFCEKAISDILYAQALSKIKAEKAAAEKILLNAPIDTTKLETELQTALKMKKHQNTYQRMLDVKARLSRISALYDQLSRKGELAEKLSREIVATAGIKSLTFFNSLPLINGLPLSMLSKTELLELCVDATVSEPAKAETIMIGSAERLDNESLRILIGRCRDKGIKQLAIRATDSLALELLIF